MVFFFSLLYSWTPFKLTFQRNSSSNFVLLMGVAKKRGYESFPVRNPYVKMSKNLFVFENFWTRGYPIWESKAPKRNSRNLISTTFLTFLGLHKEIFFSYGKSEKRPFVSLLTQFNFTWIQEKCPNPVFKINDLSLKHL